MAKKNPFKGKFNLEGVNHTIPVFISGTSIDGRGMTDKGVNKICNNSAKAMRNRGVQPTAKIGHDSFFGGEEQKFLGSAVSFECRSVKRKATKGKTFEAIYADVFMTDEFAERYDNGEFPFVSVELSRLFNIDNEADEKKSIKMDEITFDFSDGEGLYISSIAFLGTSPPAFPDLFDLLPERKVTANDKEFSIVPRVVNNNVYNMNDDKYDELSLQYSQMSIVKPTLEDEFSELLPDGVNNFKEYTGLSEKQFSNFMDLFIKFQKGDTFSAKGENMDIDEKKYQDTLSENLEYKAKIKQLESDNEKLTAEKAEEEKKAYKSEVDVTFNSLHSDKIVKTTDKEVFELLSDKHGVEYAVKHFKADKLDSQIPDASDETLQSDGTKEPKVDKDYVEVYTRYKQTQIDNGVTEEESAKTAKYLTDMMKADDGLGGK